MKKIKITCDSTCDLSDALYAAAGADVIPMGISLGDELRRDGLDVTPAELFRHVEGGGELPKTSAVSVGEYEDVFRSYAAQGFQLVHISLSSELSSSHRNALLAAEEVGNVHVVDSRSLSSGSGHLVLLAAELAAAGLDAADIAKTLEEKRELLDVSFVLQTLEYLHKGGRCSGLATYGSNLLKIRPEIRVADGKMQVGSKYRGDMDRSVLAYVRGRLEGRCDIDTSRIFITHSGVPEELIARVRELIAQLHPFREIIETQAGCTISSHCGPHCLGVLFFKKSDAESV